MCGICKTSCLPYLRKLILLRIFLDLWCYRHTTGIYYLVNNRTLWFFSSVNILSARLQNWKVATKLNWTINANSTRWPNWKISVALNPMLDCFLLYLYRKPKYNVMISYLYSYFNSYSKSNVCYCASILLVNMLHKIWNAMLYFKLNTAKLSQHNPG